MLILAVVMMVTTGTILPDSPAAIGDAVIGKTLIIE